MARPVPLLLAAAVAFAAFAPQDAGAITRLRTDQNACAAVQGLVAREGAAILQYPSTRVPNYLLYDRYVSDARQCRFGERLSPETVPAADTPACRVFVCKEIEPLFDCEDGIGIGSRTLFCRD